MRMPPGSNQTSLTNLEKFLRQIFDENLDRALWDAEMDVGHRILPDTTAVGLPDVVQVGILHLFWLAMAIYVKRSGRHFRKTVTARTSFLRQPHFVSTF